jgi:hypothetical protein
MSNGTVGPMPERVFNTLSDSFRVHCTSPYEVYNTFGDRREVGRGKVARFLGAASDEIVLTRNTTEGMNFVPMDFRWSRETRYFSPTRSIPQGFFHGVRVSNPIFVSGGDVAKVLEGVRVLREAAA